jgi:hypothetical protein
VLFIVSPKLVLWQQKIQDSSRSIKKAGRVLQLPAAAVDSEAATCNDAVHEFFVSTFPSSCLVAQLTARGQGGK